MRRVLVVLVMWGGVMCGGASAASAEEAPAPKPPTASMLLDVPVSDLVPGNVKAKARAGSPVANDKDAPTRGMQFFESFNCIGCHAPNGGGGMGPSLSNRTYIYGGDAANLFLSIYQGRPNGMPAWGGTLPESAIWDLVAYVQNLGQAPSSSWGMTFSHDAFTTEQIPAQQSQTAKPWDFTQRFSFGQKPERAK